MTQQEVEELLLSVMLVSAHSYAGTIMRPVEVLSNLQ
jgi:hypothetical protein